MWNAKNKHLKAYKKSDLKAIGFIQTSFELREFGFKRASFPAHF